MLGIIVDDLIKSPQYHFMYKALNKMAKHEDCYLFHDKMLYKPEKNKFAVMQQIEALHHRGTLLSTNLITSQIMASSLVARRKLFYVWNLEWLYISEFGANQLKKVFYNSEIELIARSQSHYDLLTTLFKEPIAIVENWNTEKLREVIYD